MILTIEVVAADEPRVIEAFTSILNLKDDAGQPIPATATDLEQACSQWMGQQTGDYERRKNMATFAPPPLTLNDPIDAGTPEPGRASKFSKRK